MKTTFRMAIASALSLLLFSGAELMAQRSTTTTTRSGSSTTKTSTASSTRQSGTTGASSTRQSGTSTRQRGSTSSTSTSTRQSGTTTRQSGSTAGTTTRQSGTTSTSTSRQSTTSTTSRQSTTTSGTTTRQSGTTTRQSGTTTTGTTTRQSTTTNGTSTRQSGTTTRSSGTATTGTTTRVTGSTTTRSAASSTSSTGVSVVSASDGTVRSNSNVTKQGLGTVGSTTAPADGGYKTDKYGNYRDNAGNYRYGDGGQYRLDDHYNALRTPPRDRGFIEYGRPGYFYADKPHYFGYRVERLPSRVRLVSFFGINYYLYNGVYYRPYGTTFVICRPPFGTYLDIKIGKGPFHSVRFSYYTDVYRSFHIVDQNYATIAQQNMIIAQNNATIARQNAAIALNSTRANSAYNLAAQLGLVQSYAGANVEYFYQDGVFYTVSGGRYQVIIPPAGALVDSLPDDYDVITLGGVELYKVDDTVYRLTLVDGIPCLEVLGQMYGSLASQYNYYGSY